MACENLTADNRLTLGPQLPEGNPRELCDKWEWLPTGSADAVVFLGERLEKFVEDGYLHKEILFPSLEKQALRYLRPCSDNWKRCHPRQVGVSRPEGINAHFPQDIQARAEREARPIRWLVCAESPGLGSTMDATRWKWVNVEDGIWVGLFD